jgi:hypothetical protein
MIFYYFINLPFPKNASIHYQGLMIKLIFLREKFLIQNKQTIGNIQVQMLNIQHLAMRKVW